MSSSEEKFCLSWNDFASNLTTAFKDIRHDQDFLDVTLACGSNKQIQAHKVILGACSPFFRSILKNNPHQHPLLYLKGVKYEEMLSVLDFIYHGEVNVAQEDLASFLSVAKELEVKGLTQTVQEENKEVQTPVMKARTEEHEPSKSGSKCIQVTDQAQFVNPDNVKHIKTEEPVVMDLDNNQEIPDEPLVGDDGYEIVTSEYGYNQEYIDEQIRSEDKQGNDLDVAQGIVNNAHNYLRLKLLVSDFGINQNFSWKTGRSEKKNIPCEICFKTFSSKDSLRNHLGIHKGRTTCTICQKVFATISSLNLHIKNSHLKDQ